MSKKREYCSLARFVEQNNRTLTERGCPSQYLGHVCALPKGHNQPHTAYLGVHWLMDCTEATPDKKGTCDGKSLGCAGDHYQETWCENWRQNAAPLVKE